MLYPSCENDWSPFDGAQGERLLSNAVRDELRRTMNGVAI